MFPEFPDYEDELSFTGLWQVLVRQWKVVLTPAIFAIIAAAGYLSIAKPQYEAEVVLLPPEPHHVEALNISEINDATSSDVYGIFVRNLRSNALRRRFFDEHGLYSVLGTDRTGAEELVFRNRFNNRMRVTEGTREQKDFVHVTLEGEQPGFLAEWLNNFVDFVATTTVDEIVDGVETKIGNRRDSIREHIEIARKMAAQRRMDRLVLLEERLTVLRDRRSRDDQLVRLDEQIGIARELNIMDRNDGLARVLKEQSVGLSVTTGTEPLYLRGVAELVAEREALEQREDDDPFLPGLREAIAEMEVLKARTNDDPFIPELRDKEEQLAQIDAGLAQLRSSAAGVVAARVDRKAIVPESPTRPKKTRVLPLSLVGGLILGVFAAFQVNAAKQHKT